MNAITLVSLELSNFRKHRDLAIKFSPEGLTSIVGPNYAGKTTILQGAFYCLFGSAAVAGSRDNLVTSGEKGMTAILTLKQGEDTYTIRRTLTTAVVQQGDKTLASSSTEVQNWVCEKLGIPDYRTALSLAYSQQSETAALLTLGVSALNKLVERLSGADEADALIQAARDRVKKLQAKREALGELPVDDLEPQLAEAQAELKQAEASLDEATQRREKLRDERDKATERLQEADEANRKAEQFNKRLSQLQSELETTTELLQSVASGINPDALSVDLDALQEAATQASRSYDAAVEGQRMKSSAEATVKSLKSRMAELSTEYDEAEAAGPEIKMLECQLDNLRSDRDENLKCKSDAESKVKQIKKGIEDSVCFNCHRPYEGMEIKSLEEELPLAEKKLKKCTAVVKENNEDIAKTEAEFKVSKKHRNLDTIQSEYTKSEGELNKQEDILNSSFGDPVKLKTEYEEARDTFLTAKSDFAAAKKAKSAEESYSKKKEELLDQIEGVDEMEVKPLDILIQASKTITDKYDELNQAVSKATAGRDSAKLQVADLERELGERAELEDAIGQCDKSLTRMKKFAKWLSRNKSAFLASIWAGVMGLTSDFTRQTTSGAVCAITRDEESGKFNFEEEDGHARPIEIASGGQKSIAGTGMRLALAELLPSALGFVVLDEPSSELNDEHSAALSGALRGAGRQVVLVTHRQGEQFNSDHLVELGN